MALTKPKLSTNINTDTSVFSDPILVLHQGSTSADIDVGFLMNRSNGLTSNAAVIWQESSKSFVHILTNSSGAPNANLSVQSYANVSVGNVLLINNAGIYVDGTLGSAGQVLASDGSKTYWAPPGGFTGGVVSGATVFQSNLVLSNTTASTNNVTGALVVLGGAGIAGNVYAGGNVVLATGAQSNVIIGDGSTSSNVVITGTRSSISTSTGALIVKGGVGIVGALNIGSYISTSSFVGISSNLQATSIGGTSALYTSGGISIRSGNLYISGSAGNAIVAAGNMYIGGVYSTNGIFWAGNGAAFTSTTLANTAEITANLVSGQNVGLSLTATGVAAGNYGSATSIPTIVVDSKGRVTSVTSNTVSTTITLAGGSGSGSVAGGDTLTVNGTTNQITTAVSSSTITIALAQNVTAPGNLTVTGNLVANSGTASSSTTTGALIVTGGAGVSGNVYSDKIYITNGVFWSGNGNVYQGLSDNPFDSESNLGLTTDSVYSDFDLGFVTTVNLSQSYDLGSIVSNSVVYGTSIIANSIPGSQLIAGTNVTFGNVTTANIDITAAATVNGNLKTANILPQANSTYSLGNSSMRWKDIFLSGSSIYLGSAVISANVSANTVQVNGVDIATVDNYDLDDISGYTNGITQVFNLTYNLANVSFKSPWQLTVAVNGIPQPAFNNSPNASIVWQSFVFPAHKGYTLSTNNQIKFTEAPAARSDIYIRKQSGTTPTTIKIYPFKPVDIMMTH